MLNYLKIKLLLQKKTEATLRYAPVLFFHLKKPLYA